MPGGAYPRVGFIMTNTAGRAESVVGFFNKHATCEHYSTSRKARARSTGRVFSLTCWPAYNLANFLRTLATPELIKHWSLTGSRRS